MPPPNNHAEVYAKTKQLVDKAGAFLYHRIGELERMNSRRAQDSADILKVIHGGVVNTSVKLNDVGQDLGKVHDTAEKIHLFEVASVTSEGLAQTGESIFNAVQAFRNGRNYQGIAESLRASSGMMRVVMMSISLAAPGLKMLGPLSAVLTNFAEMFIFFIESMEKEDKALIDQIESKVRLIAGEEHEYALSALVQLFNMQNKQLQGYKANSIDTWSEVVKCSQTLGGGGELLALFRVKGWLDNEENQKLEDWAIVFEAYLAATREFLNECDTAVAILNKTTKNKETGAEIINATEIGACSKFMIAYADTEGTYIESLDAIAANQGKFWSIGNNDRIYHSKVSLVDKAEWEGDFGGLGHNIRAVALRLGPGDRIWHLGDNGFLFHEEGADWQGIPAEFAAGVKDFTVALGGNPGVHAVTFLTQCGAHGYFEYRSPDYFEFTDTEVDSEHKELIAGTPRYPDPKGFKYTSICCDDDGRFFGLTPDGHVIMSGTDLVLQPRVGPILIPPDGEGNFVPRMISVAGGVLSIVGTRSIRRLRLSAVDWSVDAWKSYIDNAWSAVPAPERRAETEDWDYESISSMDDGSIITTIGQRLHLWHGGKWRADRSRGKESKAACGRPAQGWDSLGTVRDKIVELRELEAEMKKKPVEALPAG